MAIHSAHAGIGFLVAVKRHIEADGLVLAHGVYDLVGGKAVGEEGVVRVVLVEPGHYLPVLGMQHELAAFEAYHGPGRNAFAADYGLDFVETEAFVRLLPYGAMLAARLADGRSIDHQLAQFLMSRPQHIVREQQAIMYVIPYLVHIFCKLNRK